MSPLKRRLLEDRSLRDAARAVLRADIDLLKADVAEQGLASRGAQAGTDYLRTVGEGALDLARQNKGATGGLFGLAVAGLAAWFFREEIADVIGGILDGVEEPEQGDEADIPPNPDKNPTEPQ